MPSRAGRAAAKVGDFSRRRGDLARLRAEQAADRISHNAFTGGGTVRAAPVRSSFIRAHEGAPAPLIQLIRGGRGGEVRLKLFLSILWIAVKKPYAVSFPARAWAELLDLSDPAGAGARRVLDAIGFLEQARLILVCRKPGQPPEITLQDDGGRGTPYRPPHETNERYVRLPSQFWTGGWLVSLSGAALALMLILLDQYNPRSKREAIWLAPRVSRELYGLSPDTWTRASVEIEHYGLVDVVRKPVDEAFAWRRVRNTYILHRDRLEITPDESITAALLS